MSNKSKAAKPAKPQVTVTRPAATVTVTVQGTVHKMTEDEAKELYASLGKALGVQQESMLRKLFEYQRPPDPPPFRPFQIPIPRYISAPRPHFDDRVMCSSSNH